jgi:uncharacterized coiled-coil protein SlyX
MDDLSKTTHKRIKFLEIDMAVAKEKIAFMEKTVSETKENIDNIQQSIGKLSIISEKLNGSVDVLKERLGNTLDVFEDHVEKGKGWRSTIVTLCIFFIIQFGTFIWNYSTLNADVDTLLKQSVKIDTHIKEDESRWKVFNLEDAHKLKD